MYPAEFARASPKTQALTLTLRNEVFKTVRQTKRDFVWQLLNKKWKVAPFSCPAWVWGMTLKCSLSPRLDFFPRHPPPLHLCPPGLPQPKTTGFILHAFVVKSVGLRGVFSYPFLFLDGIFEPLNFGVICWAFLWVNQVLSSISFVPIWKWSGQSFLWQHEVFEYI